MDVARRGGGDECGAGEEVGVVRRGGGECGAPGRRRWMWRAKEEVDVVLGRGECASPGKRRWMWCAGEEVSRAGEGEVTDGRQRRGDWVRGGSSCRVIV